MTFYWHRSSDRTAAEWPRAWALGRAGGETRPGKVTGTLSGGGEKRLHGYLSQLTNSLSSKGRVRGLVPSSVHAQEPVLWWWHMTPSDSIGRILPLFYILKLKTHELFSYDAIRMTQTLDGHITAQGVKFCLMLVCAFFSLFFCLYFYLEVGHTLDRRDLWVKVWLLTLDWQRFKCWRNPQYFFKQKKTLGITFPLWSHNSKDFHELWTSRDFLYNSQNLVLSFLFFKYSK